MYVSPLHRADSGEFKAVQVEPSVPCEEPLRISSEHIAGRGTPLPNTDTTHSPLKLCLYAVETDCICCEWVVVPQLLGSGSV